MLLYTKKQLEYIRSKLKEGILKFDMPATTEGKTYKALFSGDDNVVLQRIPNFMLGLAYKKDTDEFIFNYPHLDNIRPEQIAEIQNPILSKKENGTNTGLIKTNTGTIYRTRGSISPERFLNDINTKIISNETLIGIKPEAATSFKINYDPILEAGKEKGIIDDFGCFTISKIINDLLTQKEELKMPSTFDINGKSARLIGIFGELCSRYNPIAIDGELKFGLYLNIDKDYEWVIFDFILQDKEGNIHLQPVSSTMTESTNNIRYVETSKLKDIKEALASYGTAEGLVIKEANHYWKFKQEDVIAWERLMGKLSNILYFSAEHVFQQGLGFSNKEIFEDKVLLKRESTESIITQVWQEVNANGISRKDLEEYFASKKDNLEEAIEGIVVNNLLLLLAPNLQSNGIPKEKIYSELPKFMAFKKGEPMFFDEAKKKWRANQWYGRLVARVIGKVYLKR